MLLPLLASATSRPRIIDEPLPLPASQDFDLWRGVTFRQRVAVLQFGTGHLRPVPRDLKRYTPSFTVYPNGSDALAFNAVVEVKTKGRIVISLDADSAAAITWTRAPYELQMDGPNGLEPLLYGHVNVKSRPTT